MLDLDYDSSMISIGQLIVVENTYDLGSGLRIETRTERATV